MLRPNALGNFCQLLGAVAHHPAMRYYLDNWLSSGVNMLEAKGRFKGLNENYGRELLELHTMGVDSGYTQADVISLARILSGWIINEKGVKDGQPGPISSTRAVTISATKYFSVIPSRVAASRKASRRSISWHGTLPPRISSPPNWSSISSRTNRNRR